MKRLGWVALTLLMGAGCITTREVVVEEPWVDSSLTPQDVQRTLSPYGTWVYVEGLGRVWQPSRTRVGSGFYPYATQGQWVTVNGQWWFDSTLPFGDVVYHYGRWYHDPFYSWVWYPGYQWAPAWVNWRFASGHVGWAPLPPAAVGVNNRSPYVYVRQQDFTRRDPYVRALPPSLAHTIDRTARAYAPSSPPGSGTLDSPAPSVGGSRGPPAVRAQPSPGPSLQTAPMPGPGPSPLASPPPVGGFRGPTVMPMQPPPAMPAPTPPPPAMPAPTPPPSTGGSRGPPVVK